MAGQGVGAYNVDIVMCIDATGSMFPIIDKVKENALSFYQRFVDAMEESDKTVEQLRIKVIAFRDYGCDDKPMEESEFFTLPKQNEEFRACVSGITACGGGDAPENALEAIALALKSKWTTVGTKRRHVILVFSDAAALPLGARASSDNYPSDLPKDLPQLGAWWERTDQTQTLDSTYIGSVCSQCRTVDGTSSVEQILACLLASRYGVGGSGYSICNRLVGRVGLRVYGRGGK